MKTLALAMAAGMLAGAAGAQTFHRSFKNGYPVVNGVSVRQEPNAAVFKSSKPRRQGPVVITNRVVLTKAQVREENGEEVEVKGEKEKREKVEKIGRQGKGKVKGEKEKREKVEKIGRQGKGKVKGKE